MAIEDVPDTIMELQGAGTEYEYQYGSYADMLEKQLAAIRNQAELEEKRSKEEGLLGTRNMAILNAALTGRGVVEGMRERYITQKINDAGGIGKQRETWDYDKESGFWGGVGRAVFGWQKGIHAIAAKGETTDDVITGKSSETIKENLDENGVSEELREINKDVDTNEPYPVEPSPILSEPTDGATGPISSAVYSEEALAEAIKLSNVEEGDPSTTELLSQYDTRDSFDKATDTITKKRKDAGDINAQEREFLSDKTLSRHGDTSEAVDDWIAREQTIVDESGAKSTVGTTVDRAKDQVKVLKSEGLMEKAHQDTTLSENVVSPSLNVSAMSSSDIDTATVNMNEQLNKLKDKALNTFLNQPIIDPLTDTGWHN